MLFGFSALPVTPFAIQCFVTAGVALNMAGLALVMGFASGLLPQLRRPGSGIVLDDSSASWIASLPAFVLIVGNFITPGIMSNCGRRIANMCSLMVAIAGWLCIVLANSVTLLILARFVQGIGMGMTGLLAPVLVGEYTSPSMRGLFLMSMSVIFSVAVFSIQTMGQYLSWKICASVCMGIAFCAVVIVIFSPESPTFLANKEKYDECRKVFRYLRGDKEEEELEKMIATRIKAKEEEERKPKKFKDKILTKCIYLKQASEKKEFYKPIIIMMHVYTMAQWCGVNMITSYPTYMFERIVGLDSGINISLMVVLTGVHRILGNLIGLIMIKALRRRVLLFSTIVLNIVALSAIAAYTYMNDKKILPSDQPTVGIVLVHVHMFSIATGAMPLAFVLAGELYPIEYRGICAGISMISYSLNLFASTKTVLMFFSYWGIYGTYCVHAGILVYCLVVIGVLLPETKDKTLHDIEEQFRGKISTPK